MIKTSARNNNFLDYEKPVETAEFEAGRITGAAGHFRELNDRLVDTTEQLRHVTNQTSELENEILSLRYQLQLATDDLRESNESLLEVKRQVKQKTSELRQRDHTILELQSTLEAARNEISAKDDLIRESGLLAHRASLTNNDESPSIVLSTAVIPADLLSYLEDIIPGKSVTEQLRQFADQVHIKDLDFRRMQNELQDTKRKLEDALSKTRRISTGNIFERFIICYVHLYLFQMLMELSKLKATNLSQTELLLNFELKLDNWKKILLLYRLIIHGSRLHVNGIVKQPKGQKVRKLS